MTYKLILMDIDGTIADRNSDQIYPHVLEFLECLPSEVDVVFVTNQGGPAWPEGVDYNYRGGDHELRVFMRIPSSGEIETIRKGEARFALVLINGLLFFCFKFGDMPWSDSSFEWHLIPENERIIPPGLKPNEHALLNVILIDAENGIIKVLRALTLSPKFSQRLHVEIIKQSQRAMPENYETLTQEIYNRYPTTEQMVDQYTIVRCKGGE